VLQLGRMLERSLADARPSRTCRYDSRVPSNRNSYRCQNTRRRNRLSSLKAKEFFGLEMPAIANYTTGEVMAVSSDRLAAWFGVSRED